MTLSRRRHRISSLSLFLLFLSFSLCFTSLHFFLSLSTSPRDRQSFLSLSFSLSLYVSVPFISDVVRPISKAKFLGVEIDNSLRFKEHIQDLALRAEKRLNILRILAWGGTAPKTLLRLYKVYIRSIFEYGCIAFLHVADSTLEILQKVQNKAIRIALRLHRYVSLKVLHENARLPAVKERLRQLGFSLLGKMGKNNPLIKNVIQEKEADNLYAVRQGQYKFSRSHRSPLDILLPAQRPFLNSS